MSPRFLRRPALALLAVVLTASLALLAWAACAPIRAASRDEPFAIPKGTWARRMAGNKVEILPSEVQLTLGLNDTLLLQNNDDVPQIFGPVLIMPGQSFRLPFALASDYHFACTAHASGQMSVIVKPMPATPGARLQWRWQRLLAAARRHLSDT